MRPCVITMIYRVLTVCYFGICHYGISGIQCNVVDAFWLFTILENLRKDLYWIKFTVERINDHGQCWLSVVSLTLTVSSVLLFARLLISQLSTNCSRKYLLNLPSNRIFQECKKISKKSRKSLQISTKIRKLFQI